MWKFFLKIARKSENAVNCNRVLTFVYDTELQYVVSSVQASMRDRSYKVEVSNAVSYLNNTCRTGCR